MKKLVLASAISTVTTSAMAVTSSPVQLIDRYKVARTCEIDMAGTTVDDENEYGDRVFTLEVKTNATVPKKRLTFDKLATQHVDNPKIVEVGSGRELNGQTIEADGKVKVQFTGDVQAKPDLDEGTSLRAYAEVTASCL